MRKLAVLLVCACLCSCESIRYEESDYVAKLGNEVLLYEDIESQLPPTGTLEPADSIAMIQTIVRNWAKNKLIVKIAEFNLKEDLKNFEDLVDKYRNDLLKHAYIERYVGENLDTNVSEEEIVSYYDTHRMNFELKESIVKGQFVAAPIEAQKVNRAKSWFTDSEYDEEYYDWIEVFATKQSAYTDSSWVPLDEFLNDIPLETSNPYSYLKRTPKFTCEDTVMVYFVNINDIRIKNSHSPIEYVKKNIRKMILNKRRLELVEQIEENILSNAIEKGDLLIP